MTILKLNPTEKETHNSMDNNDNVNFELIFNTFTPKIKNFAYKILKDYNKAEDITQDILVKIWEKQDLVLEAENKDYYIFRLAKNEIFNFIKQETRHYDPHKKVQLGDSLNINSKKDIEEEYLAKELQHYVNLVVKSLPPQQQKIYILSRDKGLTNKEISEELGINKRTVENHLTKALATLRRNIILFVILSFISH